MGLVQIKSQPNFSYQSISTVVAAVQGEAAQHTETAGATYTLRVFFPHVFPAVT